MMVSHGFELKREEEIPELNSKGMLYRHIKTGAELLSLVNTDENKVFGITFRTPPSDSTGVPHIMEHSVLCGSRKYPVKEPFVELMKGSLNTFLNAMTYPDKTCYPVASQNMQDFYNLIDVYLDAVFYPLITPYTLKQEGWHYALDGSDGKMTFKGVVYNEMKGSYSSPESVLDEISQHQVFPDNPYRFDGGGDPARIPDLTYEQFKRFHSTYYHPSNSRIFFYGDDDPEKRLEILDEYLRNYDQIQVDSSISLQPRFSQPRKITRPYEVSAADNEQKAYVTVNWMLPESGNPELTIGLSVLEHILTGTSASPLRKALIDSGLGEDLVGRGLELGSRQLFFSTGLKGIQLEKTEQVESLILATLGELSQKGIDPDTVAASLNTVEFALRENNTGSFPRGIAIMLRALYHWLYDQDPFSALRLDAPLAAIKSRVGAGERYFENMLQEFLVNNQHRVTVVLQPDPELANRRAGAEQARLDQARASMSHAEFESVAADTAELVRRQETPDDPHALAKIPTLKLSDLDREVRHIPAELIPVGESSILYHDLFTNGILYLDLGFNLHTLPQDWLPVIPLFGRALTEMGTRSATFVQLLQRIGRSTGGIHDQTFISHAPERTRAEAWLFLRSKAMVNQVGELLSILKEILLSVRLDDRERFRQMALEEKSSLESALVYAGHRMVNTRLKGSFDEAGWANEQMSGISYLFFLRGLINQIDQDWNSVSNRLEEIRAALLNRTNMVCNVTLDAANWTQVRPQLEAFIQGLPDVKARVQDWKPVVQAVNEGLTIPSQVNFVGKAANIYQAGYDLHGSAMAILQYLNTTWMWEKVRVQGGAYGGFLTFDQYSGVVSYLSYRDPNLLSTIQYYDQTADFLSQREVGEAELTKSIIGAVGDLDAYLLPDAKGYSSMLRYLLGVTDERRQKLRNELLAAAPADFRKMAAALESVKRDGLVAVLGSNEAIQAASTTQPGWLEIKKIL